jgi:NAD+ synthase (glutamine-hydrolysing)
VRIALAQVDPTVGDMAGNAARIAARVDEARGAGAALVATP